LNSRFDRSPPTIRNRVNLQIRSVEVRLKGPDDEDLGVVPTDQARALAREKGLDLVEISASANPPVCRVMDFGKFKYEQKKKENEARKRQHTMDVKEVRLRTRTDEHDVETKLKKARQFLLEGDKVSFYVMFRGREVVHPEIGAELLRKVATDLQDVGKIERPPKLDGKRMTMVVTPVRR
jgi:translation initiation factor IF-3